MRHDHQSMAHTRRGPVPYPYLTRCGALPPDCAEAGLPGTFGPFAKDAPIMRADGEFVSSVLELEHA